MTDTAKFDTAAAARAFILGGNATVTLVSLKTGARYTYKVQASEDGQVHFVKLLNGPDNQADFKYLGRIASDGRFWPGRRFPKSGDITASAPSSQAFGYVWERLVADRMPGVEIWHEGRCGRCGRKLTVPSSIASGFGPECIGKV